MNNKYQKEKNLNYGIFSPKFHTSRHLKLEKAKMQNSKYFKALLCSPTNFNSHIKYTKTKIPYFYPEYTNGVISPLHQTKSKLKKSCSQKNLTSRPLSASKRLCRALINDLRIIKSPIYKTTSDNKNITYNDSTENKNNLYNLETEKLYQETTQTKKLLKYLTHELLALKKENEDKDRQITIKEKQINDIILKTNPMILGRKNLDNDDINKVNDNSTNNSYITNNNNNKSLYNSNYFDDSIYLNALSSNRNSSTSNLFLRIKKEIKKTNTDMKLENDKFEKLKKSVFITKMNELNIESLILKEQLNKINSLLENAFLMKNNNENKNKEKLKLKENIEKQEKIKKDLTIMIIDLENKESNLKTKLELNEFELRNKIKEVNTNITKLVILKKKNENLNKKNSLKNDFNNYYYKSNDNPIQINSIYRSKIQELKKSINFYKGQLKHSNDELTKLKEKRKKLIDTEKIKGLKINLDINNKEKENITLIKNDLKKKEESKPSPLTDEEKIKKLKDNLKAVKDHEKKIEQKMNLYLNKLKELEIIEEEKERKKEEMNNLNDQNQSQIEFGIDSDNPFYTEDEANFPEISFKFTSGQFNQFTYVLFKNFEAKDIVEEESKNKIILPFKDYMQKNNINIVEYNSIQFKEIMEEFTKIIMNSLRNTNSYNFTLTNIFMSALFYNAECNIEKLIKYFSILFSYTRNYASDENKFLNKLKTKYKEQTKKLINCVKNYIESKESDSKEYFPLLKMKEILDKNDINLKDKYVEFLFYYLKKFENPDTKLSDLNFALLNNIIQDENDLKDLKESKEEKEEKDLKEDIYLDNSENNNFNLPIKDSEIKENTNKNENENGNENEDIPGLNSSKKENSNILDLIDKNSNINLSSQRNEIKSPTEENFSSRHKKKNSEKKSEKKKDLKDSDDFEEEEDSMTEITNEEYIKQLKEALQIMQKGLKEKKLKFNELMANVVQKRKIAGVFYECISVEDFNDQFKSIDIILSDLKLSCLCSKYSIPNELRLIDKNKMSKDIEKQEKGILKFSEEDEEEDDFN